MCLIQDEKVPLKQHNHAFIANVTIKYDIILCLLCLNILVAGLKEASFDQSIFRLQKLDTDGVETPRGSYLRVKV